MYQVVLKNTTRLCSTKPIVTVNGKFPGPTLYAREDDNVLVNVVNHVNYNVSIHWHGVRQLRTGWYDGPAYITQCPIQPEQNYLYNFTFTGQRGTLLWHAHISWLRSTMHGAIVILPKKGVHFPFPKPDKQKIIILEDTEAVVNQAIQTGLAPNLSCAHTINGYSGPVSNCSSEGAYTLHVENSKTYLLRVINAALNDELFFKIAGHDLTVVEVDAAYESILVAISPLMDTVVAVDTFTGTGYLRYNHTHPLIPTTMTHTPPVNATSLTFNFSESLRSLNSKEYPAKVPLTIDHSLLFNIGVGINPCATCSNGSKAVAAISNVTFGMPTVAILESHYYGINGTMNGTRVYRLAYNSTVELVIQGNSILAPESHPTHLHGFNFFVVGRGLGNYNPEKDPEKFNLVDPVERNTISVPTAGWTAIRFRADNPGVWFFRCHLEVHTTWGLKMAFLVENGNGPNESLPPPPSDLPRC
ncbi:Laccase-2 [Hibiscus syriacus]|uniref:Laccase-2 n=1 Tax=Hibiscus syriacus TaxID=106335 RepID=A0A6A3AAS1_HIBSY|nr:Laccase-2 [Hibiscus syriacus]